MLRLPGSDSLKGIRHIPRGIEILLSTYYALSIEPGTVEVTKQQCGFGTMDGHATPRMVGWELHVYEREINSVLV